MIAYDNLVRHFHCCADSFAIILVAMFLASMLTLYLIRARR